MRHRRTDIPPTPKVNISLISLARAAHVSMFTPNKMRHNFVASRAVSRCPSPIPLCYPSAKLCIPAFTGKTICWFFNKNKNWGAVAFAYKQ